MPSIRIYSFLPLSISVVDLSSLHPITLANVLQNEAKKIGLILGQGKSWADRQITISCHNPFPCIITILVGTSQRGTHHHSRFFSSFYIKDSISSRRLDYLTFISFSSVLSKRKGKDQLDHLLTRIFLPLR